MNRSGVSGRLRRASPIRCRRKVTAVLWVLFVSLACAAPHSPATAPEATRSRGRPPLACGERTLDLVLVFDRSEDSRKDWDGELSIAKQEEVLARRFTDAVQRPELRIGIVTFPEPGDLGSSRRRGSTPRYDALSPLASDPAKIAEAFDELAEQRSRSGGDVAMGIDHALIELLGLRGADSSPRSGGSRSILVFADGMATLPYPAGTFDENAEAVLRAIDRVEKIGVGLLYMLFDPEPGRSTRKYAERLRAAGVDVMEVPDAPAAERALAQLVECFRVPPGAETERAAPER